MDKRRGNIVVSRRSILEEDRAEHRQEVSAELNEGDEREGVVKNRHHRLRRVRRTCPGVDGLLHVTDMSWSASTTRRSARRQRHGSRQDHQDRSDTHRISLGIKRLRPDPWQGVAAKYPVSAKFRAASPASPITARLLNWKKALKASSTFRK
ncbi:MAG: hypothetical protein R3C60_13950 [Parvularculaceae bacterium]